MEILNQIGAILNTIALVSLPVVVLTAVGSSQPIFVLLVCVILHKLYGNKFKESIEKENIIKKMICFLFIIIGIILTVL